MRHRIPLSLVVLTSLCSMLPAQTATAPAGKVAWTPVGLCGGGGLKNPAVSPHDPNLMLVESDMGGKYITRDGGKNWTMYNHAEMSTAWAGGPAVFSPLDKYRMYSLSGGAADQLFVSSSAGRMWRPFPAAAMPRTGRITRLYIQPDLPGRLAIGTMAGGFFTTDDEGKMWRQGNGLEGAVIRIVATPPEKDGHLNYYVGTTRGVYAAEDDGKLFTPRVTGLPESGLTGFAGGSDGKTSVLYATAPCRLVDGKLAGGVYVSKDLGKNWQRAMNPKINVQTQRASEWAHGELPQYRHIVASDKDPRRAYVYCGGTSYFPPNGSTIYRTDDAGASWREVWFHDPRFKEYNHSPDWMTSYRGTSWMGGPISLEMSAGDPDVVLWSDGMWMWATRDGGKNWQGIHAFKSDPAETDDAKITWRNNGLVNTTTWNYYVDPHQPRRHYIAYTDIGFARSLDGGLTWRWWGPGIKEEGDTPVPRAWSNTTYELAFDPETPGRIWGAHSAHHDIPNENSIWRGTGKSSHKGGVCVSQDFGQTWTVANKGLPEAPVLSVILDPRTPKGRRTLYASVYDHGVFKSVDDGATWQAAGPIGSDFNRRVCRLELHKDGTLFCLVTGMRTTANGPFSDSGVGLYRSADVGATWQRLGPRQPFLYPRDFGVDPADSKLLYLGVSDAPSGYKKDSPAAQPPPAGASSRPTPGGPMEIAQQGGLWKSADGGQTWELILRKRTTHFGAYFHPKHPDWIYATCTGWTAAPEGSLFLSKDRGKTWQGFPELPFAQTQRVTVDPVDPSVVYVTTFGGSVWRGPAE